jgi:hypothetical protein
MRVYSELINQLLTSSAALKTGTSVTLYVLPHRAYLFTGGGTNAKNNQ